MKFPLALGFTVCLALYAQESDDLLHTHDLLGTGGALQIESQRLIDAGDLAGAEQAARVYLGSHPDSADAHYLLGYVLFKKRDAKGSLAEYTLGARYRTPNSYDLEVVASDYVLLKDYEDADKWFVRSVEFDPSNYSALYYLGRTKYNENRFEEAIAAFNRCLQHDPKNVKYEDNLGLSYEGLGRSEEAEAAFRNAIAWDAASATPDAGPYLDLGSLLVDTNRVKEAIPMLEKSAQLQPNELRARTELGKAYLHAEQLEKAQRELEAAIALDPSSAPTHFMLAQVYRKRGLMEQARRESESYSRLNREHPSNN